MCGNGRLERGELCDDGNDAAGVARDSVTAQDLRRGLVRFFAA
ncbi:MAG: hypothetical protein HY905_02835 [Deltaproteobacteria bacterium]|nr:hypothetical protein [Deltaproteobacteria bacterium]